MVQVNRRALLQLSASMGLATPALAQTRDAWPNQPVRLICPFAAGGPTDVAARLVADGLSGTLPQRFVVENRTGSGVVVGTEAVAKAPKDGHTFLYSTVAHSVLRPLFSNLSFDPVGDFQPVALVGVIPMLLMLNNNVPAKSLKELMEMFRAAPGRYDYGSSGAGGAVHLATELFLHQAGGLKVNHIPYRGSAPAMPDLLNGNLVMILNVASDGVASVQRGTTRGLAISSARRMPQLPDIPTFAEAGLPGYEAYTWHMLFAPAGTPAEIVRALNENVNKVMQDPRTQQRFAEMTIEPRSDTTPESATQWLHSEMAKWEPLVKAAGIRPS
ncbi:Bug family tripartite tricarboxylate transporter substrate binding protein [Roseomonas xinghualingensis]|uniref:Bug family tripartite tricarboxylate transporter substrate binding protein n=1 Tax=Roseomonas xinghualingensis TaxID=2986475 RepID=UPI0021F2428F|nr:tripartite tricarboxylate transporter substrate binding protein [Roseomonas sp. SXEYE001]MCV4208694.1 tripartite tricarboxylate transporter substrate binding protein [Roseomonas sp. SXEYE001]